MLRVMGHRRRERGRGPGNPVGDYALGLGSVALVCLVVPVIGEPAAALAGLGAVVLGFVALRRHEDGLASGTAPALVGAVLGMVAVVGVGVILAGSPF